MVCYLFWIPHLAVRAKRYDEISAKRSFPAPIQFQDGRVTVTIDSARLGTSYIRSHAPHKPITAPWSLQSRIGKFGRRFTLVPWKFRYQTVTSPCLKWTKSVFVHSIKFMRFEDLDETKNFVPGSVTAPRSSKIRAKPRLHMRFSVRFLMRFRVQNAPYPTPHGFFVVSLCLPPS